MWHCCPSTNWGTMAWDSWCESRINIITNKSLCVIGMLDTRPKNAGLLVQGTSGLGLSLTKVRAEWVGPTSGGLGPCPSMIMWESGGRPLMMLLLRNTPSIAITTSRWPTARTIATSATFARVSTTITWVVFLNFGVIFYGCDGSNFAVYSQGLKRIQPFPWV